MDKQWRNQESGTEHGRRCDMERGEIARRIETKRLAALGIQLADADRGGNANSDRSGNRFTGQDAIRAPRCGSRHLHDQPSVADQSRGSVSLPASAGCQPVLPRVSTATSILLKFAAA